MKWVSLAAIALIAIGMGLQIGNIGSALIACGIGLILWCYCLWLNKIE